MLGPMVCLATMAIGIEVGWEPRPEGGVAYLIQIEPQLLESLKAGDTIKSDLLPEVRDVREFRITVATPGRKLPRVLPPAAAANPSSAPGLGPTMARGPGDSTPPSALTFPSAGPPNSGPTGIPAPNSGAPSGPAPGGAPPSLLVPPSSGSSTAPTPSAAGNRFDRGTLGMGSLDRGPSARSGDPGEMIGPPPSNPSANPAGSPPQPTFGNTTSGASNPPLTTGASGSGPTWNPGGSQPTRDASPGMLPSTWPPSAPPLPKEVTPQNPPTNPAAPQGAPAGSPQAMNDVGNRVAGDSPDAMIEQAMRPTLPPGSPALKTIMSEAAGQLGAWLTTTLIALSASLTWNGYLVWLLMEARRRYRSLVKRMLPARSGADLSPQYEDEEYTQDEHSGQREA